MKAKLPEGDPREAWDKLVFDHSKNPRGVAAAIMWLLTEKRQYDCAQEFDTTKNTLRRYRDLAAVTLDMDLDEYQSEEQQHEIAEDAAELLGLEEGKHYSITQDGYRGTKSAHMLKAGWDKLREIGREFVQNSGK